MTLDEVMAALEKLGTEQTRKTWTRHGAKGPMFGVKIGDMKSVLKKIRNDQPLAMQLYRTGNLDAMYLAGLVADGAKMSTKELQSWVKSADWRMISEYTVAWVAAESPFGRELALEWIDSRKPHVACAGWNTYSGLISTTPDSRLDLKEIERLLDRIAGEIAKAPNRVRYCMNNFVIGVAGYCKPLLAKAKAVAAKIGKVEVDVGDTSCKVPVASEYIAMLEKKGRIGVKRKTCKC